MNQQWTFEEKNDMAIAWMFRAFEQFDGILNRPLDEVAYDDDGITFWFQDGEGMRYEVEGDCCSRSWVEHVTIPNGIEGKVIREVKSHDIVGPLDHQDNDYNGYEYIQVYANAFVTDAGEIIFEYRNSSNGYYGGYLTGPEKVSRQ